MQTTIEASIHTAIYRHIWFGSISKPTERRFFSRSPGVMRYCDRCPVAGLRAFLPCALERWRRYGERRRIGYGYGSIPIAFLVG